MSNSDFWDESVEDAMGQHMIVGDDGRTKAADSDTPNPAYRSDTYYARSNIAQLAIHEKSAEELISSLVTK
jgi:hypothetical protein